MGTMLDAYDMQMLDYTNDLDIQMHPSSSDQWSHDESKMEEDGPQTMKPENHSQTQKTDGHLLMKIEPFLREKADVTIEVDMESYETNVEYEMLDDEEHKASSTEFLDVDVYDVSNAHSPSMLDADALDLENHNLATLDNGDIALSTSYKDLSPNLHHETLEPHFFLSSAEGSSELQSESEPSGFDSHKNAELDLPTSTIGTADGDVQEASRQDISDDREEDSQPDDQNFGGEEVAPSGDALSESIYPTNTEASGQEDSLYLHVQSGADLHSPLPETSELAGDPITPVTSSGDPHEISEGVYIDPPPPVLLSMAPAEDFHFSFFNHATEWTQNDLSSSNVVLPQYPTLYYEPLSSVFEALRQDELAQSISNVIEAELILDAIDLELSIPEDNIYAREISLHDLNILHDALGFSGPLRMRLNFTTPRFIVRYHALQDQITRLHLEQPNHPQAGEETAEEKNEEPLIVPGEHQEENEQVNENEPSKEQDHDNLSQYTVQDVVSEVLATVDGQYDTQDSLPDPNEESDLQHSTDKDTTEESHVNRLISSDQDENNLYPTAHDPALTTDVHSRSSEAKTYSGDSNIISLGIVEDEWDHEPDDVGGDHVSEDSDHSSKVDSSIHTKEQELKDMSQPYVHLEVTEQDDPVNSWQETDDHDEVDHADPAFAEDEELYTHKVESTFDEQESVLDVPEPESETIGGGGDYGDLLELPTDPINFEAENWDDDQDGEGELDVNWGLENEITSSNSNHSSVTLASKRSFDEVDSVGDDDGHSNGTLSPTSPGQKRSRTH